MVGERDRLRISLEANFQAALCADFDDARGSEGVGPATRRSGGTHGYKKRRERDYDPR